MRRTSIGITGAAGFIGSHLRNTLSEMGYRVIAFEGDVRFKADVRAFVEQCDCVFHLAARNRASDEEILDINIQGARVISETAVEIGGKHIILSSSNLVERKPDTPYSKSKSEGERLFGAIAGHNGCKASIVRIANVYGAGCRPFYNSVVATFCWYAAKGRAHQIPIHSDGSQETDYVAVEDVVKAFLQCLEQESDFQRYDVKGTTFSVRRLADVILDETERKNFPALQTEYEFFAAPSRLAQKPVREYPIHSRESGSFQELIHSDEAEFGQLSICTIAPGSERGGHYHYHKEEWFCVIKGRMALDFFTIAGEYLETQLLEAEHPRFVHIPTQLFHIVRGIGAEEVKFLILCNEIFDHEEPDTFTLPFWK